MFGGAAQNPIRVLSKILAAMHDDNGRVTIPGFYDGVKELPPNIKADLAALNLTAEQFLGQVGLKAPAGEKDRMLIELITTRPTAEINGIIGGYTGEGAKTVLPAQGIGEGVVPSGRRPGSGKGPRRVPRFREGAASGRLHGRIRQFRGRPRPSARVRQPGADKARDALKAEWGKTAVTMGAGGSIPIVGDFKSVLGMDSVMVGFALDDDRVHSPNEKFDLKSFHKGIRSWARILDALSA